MIKINSFLKTVGFVDNWGSRDLFIDLSKNLKEKLNSDIHIYCQNNVTKVQYEKFNYFKSINIIPAILKGHEKVINQEILEKLRIFEKTIFPISWFTIDHRQFGRGFSFNAPNFPRLFNDRIPRNFINYYYYKQICFWEKEFKKKKIRILIQPNLLEAKIGKKYGVINRTFCQSRLMSYYSWQTNEHWDNFLIEKKFYQLKKFKKKSFQINEMSSWISRILESSKKNKQFNVVVKRIIRKIWGHLYWRILKKQPTNYSLLSEIRYLIRTYSKVNFLSSNKLEDFRKIKHKKYIFYPLQVEPERNLQGNSPEFFNQTEAILLLARHLPLDMYLVIREHIPAAPVRSNSFYDQLRLDFPNVFFVNSKTTGIEIIKESYAVATINSSAGIEGAIMGKPVISFSNHNPYNFLKHVFVTQTDSQVKSAINKIYHKRINLIKARVDGAKLAEAIKMVSVDLPHFFSGNSKLSKTKLDLCYKKLIETL